MLTKVEITNFLSIKDKAVLKFNKDITAIIGKNESGKSSILNAIVKLNGATIEESEKNVNCKNQHSEITGIFKVDIDEIRKVNLDYFGDEKNNIGIYLLPEEFGDLYFSLTIEDECNSEYYSLFYMKDGKLIKIDNSLFIDRIRKHVDYIKDELGESSSEMEFDTFTKMAQCESEEDVMNMYNENSLLLRDEVKAKFNELINEMSEYKWLDLLPNYKFVKFSSFTDILNDEILISDIENNVQAKNLLRIANINAESLKKAVTDNKQAQITTMEKYCDVRISDKFKKIYKQADADFTLKIKIDTRENKLLFFTNDKTSAFETIPLSKRSDGFRWYLSMYLTLYDYIEGNGEAKYILLIDEPNMYLHASAQKDLLDRVFKEEFGSLQILYSTHSPYMIDTNNLYSLKIVEKVEQTKIYNNPQDYVKETGGFEVDTITPLMTALDLHISNNLTFSTNDKLLLVEGPEDLYILRAFIRVLEMEPQFSDVKIIACMGATKVPYMYSYLFGMGYQVYLLLDNDKAGRDTIKELSKDLDDYFERFLTYDKKDKKINCILEDLFTEEDIEKLLPKKNPILYKRIYDNCDTMEFSDETKENFKEVLKTVIEKINSSNNDSSNEKEELLASEFK